MPHSQSHLQEEEPEEEKKGSEIRRASQQYPAEFG